MLVLPYQLSPPTKFEEKTFADNPETAKNAKVFSLKSFPLYGMTYIIRPSAFGPHELLPTYVQSTIYILYMDLRTYIVEPHSIYILYMDLHT